MRSAKEVCLAVKNAPTHEEALAILHSWEDDLREEARADGYKDGYDEGVAERPCSSFDDVDDATLKNLETGFNLLKNGDPCAEVYFDRALKDFGCGGFSKGELL